MKIIYLNPTYKDIFESISKHGFKRTKSTQLQYEHDLELYRSNCIYPEEVIVSKKYLNTIQPCDYPYDLPDVFRHDIFWMDKKFTGDIKKAIERLYLDKGLDDSKIAVIFINSQAKQSVKNIKHAHIFYDKYKS